MIVKNQWGQIVRVGVDRWALGCWRLRGGSGYRRICRRWNWCVCWRRNWGFCRRWNWGHRWPGYGSLCRGWTNRCHSWAWNWRLAGWRSFSGSNRRKGHAHLYVLGHHIPFLISTRCIEGRLAFASPIHSSASLQISVSQLFRRLCRRGVHDDERIQDNCFFCYNHGVSLVQGVSIPFDGLMESHKLEASSLVDARKTSVRKVFSEMPPRWPANQLWYLATAMVA